MTTDAVRSGFEYVACAYCGSTETEAYAELEDWLCGLPGRFKLVRCLKCGLLRQNPRPDLKTIGQYYPDEYKPFADTRLAASSLKSRLQTWSMEYGLRRRVHTVSRHQPNGRLLDVGCSTGLFLDAARRYGPWQVQGIEPSQSAVEFGRSQLGLDILQGTLDDIQFDDTSFAAVTMWDVLEHLHDPVAAVREVARILQPGGVFVVRVPHLESLDFRLFGRYWAGLDAPRHLYVFPRRVLIELLTRTGFTVVEWRCWGGYHIFALSVQFWLQAQVPKLLQTLSVSRLLLSPAVRLLALPWFALVDSWLKRGSALAIVARKSK